MVRGRRGCVNAWPRCVDAASCCAWLRVVVSHSRRRYHCWPHPLLILTLSRPPSSTRGQRHAVCVAVRAEPESPANGVVVTEVKSAAAVAAAGAAGAMMDAVGGEGVAAAHARPASTRVLTVGAITTPQRRAAAASTADTPALEADHREHAVEAKRQRQRPVRGDVCCDVEAVAATTTRECALRRCGRARCVAPTLLPWLVRGA
jgi:hypothetical protein